MQTEQLMSKIKELELKGKFKEAKKLKEKLKKRRLFE